MSARHILVANVFFAPHSYGGATVVAEEVARAIAGQGRMRVTAVSLCMRRDLAPYTMIKTQTGRIENYLINVPPGRSYGQIYDNPEVTARLAELMDALEPDIIHAHCIQDMGTGLIAAAESHGIPLILSVHDFWWLCERQFMLRLDETYCGQRPVRIDDCKGCADNFWAARLRYDHLRKMGGKAALVTYPSRFALDLYETSGFAPGRGVVWENGVHMPGAAFAGAQTARRRADPRLTFGYVGGPSHLKGWPIIRAAFERVERDDFRVLLVDGGLEERWWTPRQFRDLPGDWEIVPRYSQDRLDSVMAEIDVLLFMSQWKETFGLAIREALARGIDVIQTDSGGTVEHGAVAGDKLIPIGASPDMLRHQIDMRLSSGARGRSPVSVTSFADQARALVAHIDQILGRMGRAA